MSGGLGLRRSPEMSGKLEKAGERGPRAGRAWGRAGGRGEPPPRPGAPPPRRGRLGAPACSRSRAGGGRRGPAGLRGGGAAGSVPRGGGRGRRTGVRPRGCRARWPELSPTRCHFGCAPSARVAGRSPLAGGGGSGQDVSGRLRGSLAFPCGVEPGSASRAPGSLWLWGRGQPRLFVCS